MYLLGLIILAIAVGHGNSEIHGWMTLGGGLIFAAIWDAITSD